MKRVIFFILLFFTISSEKVFARRGCCSHHKGVSHCSCPLGMYQCRDGSHSPSCDCYCEKPKKEKINPKKSLKNK